MCLTLLQKKVFFFSTKTISIFTLMKEKLVFSEKDLDHKQNDLQRVVENNVVMLLSSETSTLDFLTQLTSQMLNALFFDTFVSDKPNNEEIEKNISVEFLMMGYLTKVETILCIKNFFEVELNRMTTFMNFALTVLFSLRTQIDFTNRIFPESKFLTYFLSFIEKFSVDDSITDILDNIDLFYNANNIQIKTEEMYSELNMYFLKLTLLGIFQEYQIQKWSILPQKICLQHKSLNSFCVKQPTCMEKVHEKICHFFCTHMSSFYFQYTKYDLKSVISCNVLQLVEKNSIRCIFMEANYPFKQYCSLTNLSYFKLPLNSFQLTFNLMSVLYASKNDTVCNSVNILKRTIFQHIRNDNTNEQDAIDFQNVGLIIVKLLASGKSQENSFMNLKDVQVNTTCRQQGVKIVLSSSTAADVESIYSHHLKKTFEFQDANLFVKLDALSCIVNSKIINMYIDCIVYGTNLLLNIDDMIQKHSKQKNLLLFFNVLRKKLLHQQNHIFCLLNERTSPIAFGWKEGEFEKLIQERVRTYNFILSQNATINILQNMLNKLFSLEDFNPIIINTFMFNYGKTEIWHGSEDNNINSMIILLSELLYRSFYLPREELPEFILNYGLYFSLRLRTQEENNYFDLESEIPELPYVISHALLDAFSDFKITETVRSGFRNTFPDLKSLFAYF